MSKIAGNAKSADYFHREGNSDQTFFLLTKLPCDNTNERQQAVCRRTHLQEQPDNMQNVQARQL